jgi:hypothetical protein
VRNEPEGLRIAWNSDSVLVREKLFGIPAARHTRGLVVLNVAGEGARLWLSYRQGQNGTNFYSLDGSGSLRSELIPGIPSGEFLKWALANLTVETC